MTRASTLVLIMAGGTGGHIYPGLAVAAVLREAGAEVRWLGASGGMETMRVPEHDIPVEEIQVSALRGKGLLGWLAGPFKLVRSVRQAARVLREYQPDCAISFGGYVAGPGGIAAWLKGVPLVVHEQNRIPGLTNRVLARVARQVLQAFPGAFPAKSGAIACGNPVRKSVTAIAPPANRWKEREGPARLLITGGSQGARRLNEILPEALKLVPVSERPIVRHQAGGPGVEATIHKYQKAGVDAEVTAYIDDMASAYAWADLVICRAGALTVSELAAAGVGAILVPFPYAVDDHQTANACFLADAGAAIILQERDMSSDSLAGLLKPLLADRSRSLVMADAARGLSQPESAQRVAEACLQWVPA